MRLFSLLEVALVILITASPYNIRCAIQISDLSNPEEYPCGIRRKFKVDIITNGWNADRGAYPWHAGIHHFAEGTHTYKCGGTLISRYFVTTAAHCVVSRNSKTLSPSVITVHLGKANLRYDEYFQIYDVLNIIKHPDYSPQKNDIALLQLRSKVEFNDFVLPICLNESKIDNSIEDINGTNGIVIGWGRTENELASDHLKVATMEVVDYFRCVPSDALLYGTVFSRSMYCAGHINGTSVCNGDSGGGMFFENNNRWYLRGIASFAAINAHGVFCDSEKYAVFTNLQYFLPWIRRKVGDDIRPRSPSTRHLCTISTEHYDCQIQNVHLKNGQFYDFGLKRNPQRKLTFKDSTLEYLPKSLIDVFPNVTLLNLKDLMITSIETKALEKAANLQTMYLEGNRLINIHQNTFSEANKLQVLVLSKNEITFCDNYAFNSNTDLQYLYLDLNQFDTLPRFTNTAKLKFLNVSHNNLESINDNHFRNQRNLKTLDASFNRLKRLNLQQLDADLDLVDVSYNVLTDFTMPTHVNRLNARNNSLTEFVVGQQCSLKQIDLSRNKLENQPELGTCNSLQHLELSYNLLEAFEIRTSMAKLQILNLRYNNLFQINLPINPPQNSLTFSLKALDLSHNKLSEGPPLSAFKKLQTVFLNDNYLISLKSYANELHTDFKGYHMANNEWSCIEIQKFEHWTHDKNNDYCKFDMKNTSGICCRVYSSPYNDRLNQIMREADFHERSNIKQMKKKYCKPVSTTSNLINLDEFHNFIANANAEEPAIPRKIKDDMIKAYNNEKILQMLQINLDRLYNARRNVAREIERQRQSHRVTREGLISDQDMLERLIKFVKKIDADNEDILSRRKNNTIESNRLFGEKQQEIEELKKNVENLQATHIALKIQEKAKKKEKEQLQ